jgi:hypothetical protein
LDLARLDSDVCVWCTPALEELYVHLTIPAFAEVGRCKFFVNLPRLQKLSMVFDDALPGERIIEDTPPSVTELKVFLDEGAESMPLVLQPGLQKLSVDANEFDVDTLFYDLHLEFR